MRGVALALLVAAVVAMGATGPAAAANNTTTTPSPMPIAANNSTTTTATATSSTATTPAAETAAATTTTATATTATAAAETAGARTLSGDGSTLRNDANISMTEDARIVGWEFAGDRVKIAIHAAALTTVTITDGAAGLEEAGATRIPQTTRRLWGGETTIVSMPVATAFGGHVVGVSIGDAGVRLSTEMQQGQDPLRYFGGTSGLFSGIGITILTSLLGAVYVLRKEESGVTKA